MDQIILPHDTSGAILACGEGVSFWGGVNPRTGVIQDSHHPQYGQSVAGKILLMPTSRASCSGSGVLLELALNGLVPAALIFHMPEDILTLSAKDSDMLHGADGPAVQLAMQAIRTLGAAQGATLLIDITRGHIDGCIFASPANLGFAEAMKDMGARVRIPTTMNAISVDLANW